MTRHWGFDTLVSPVMVGGEMLGSYVISSVGDVAVNIIPDNEGLLGNMDLFTGSGVISGIEPNPPNGTPFSIVNDATCSPGTCGGLEEGFQDAANRAWIQNEVSFALHYDGLTADQIAELEADYRQAEMDTLERLSQKAADMKRQDRGAYRFRAGGYVFSKGGETE